MTHDTLMYKIFFQLLRLWTAKNRKDTYYIILASEQQAAVACNLQSSYIYKLSRTMFFITLLGALLIGLLAIWYLTRSLRQVIKTVTRFKEGDY